MDIDHRWGDAAGVTTSRTVDEIERASPPTSGTCAHTAGLAAAGLDARRCGRRPEAGGRTAPGGGPEACSPSITPDMTCSTSAAIADPAAAVSSRSGAGVGVDLTPEFVATADALTALGLDALVGSARRARPAARRRRGRPRGEPAEENVPDKRGSSPGARRGSCGRAGPRRLRGDGGGGGGGAPLPEPWAMTPATSSGRTWAYRDPRGGRVRRSRDRRAPVLDFFARSAERTAREGPRRSGRIWCSARTRPCGAELRRRRRGRAAVPCDDLRSGASDAEPCEFRAFP